MKTRKAVSVLVVANAVFVGAANAEIIFSQDFNTGTLSAFSNATPDNGQFNSIMSSGGNATWSIASQALQLVRTGNAGTFARSTNFSPVPLTSIYSFDFTVSGISGGSAVTSAGVFQVGSGFSSTTNSTEANADTYARFAFNLGTGAANNYSFRDMTNATNTATIAGGTTTRVTWALNNTGTTITYTAPDGSTRSLANDRADFWAGNTLSFSAVNVESSSQTMTDFKFVMSNGSATVRFDNITVDGGNNSQITATGTQSFRVFQNSTPTLNVSISKTGTDATTYAVSGGDTGISYTSTGSLASGTQSGTVGVSVLNNSNGSANTGAVTKTLTIDNTAGTARSSNQGVLDANDTINLGLTVVSQRSVAAAGVDLGRQITGADLSGSNFNTTLTSSTGDDTSRTRVTVAGTTFNGGGQAAAVSVPGPTSVANTGTIGALAVTPEGLEGEGTYAPVSASYTATALEKRVVTSTASVDLGTSFVNTPVTAAASFVTTGGDAAKTRVTLANAAIPANGDGIGIAAGGTGTLFDDAADTASRTLSGTFVTVGPKSGTIGVGVATAENGGAGLTGEGAYTDVDVAYTGTALAHSNGSFNGATDIDSLSISTGTIDASATFDGSLTIHNLSGDDFGGAYTGELFYKDFAYEAGTNDGTLVIDGFTSIDAGDSVVIDFQFTPNVPGAFSTTYKFTVGDSESILGWSNNFGGLSFTLSGIAVQAVPEPLTAAGVMLLASRVLGRRARVSL